MLPVLTGAAAQHSQSLEAWFAHLPGLVVVCPSTPQDNYSLLRAALQSGDPVVYIEHKTLWGSQGPVDEALAVPLGQASNPESTEEPSAAVSAASAPAALPDASAPASAPVKPQAAVATPAPVAAPAVLRLEASADTWVDVRDAKGPVIGKLLKSGDALDISPQPPYSVSIGRAAAVKATLRGQPFDLKPHTSVSVARFEVKE